MIAYFHLYIYLQAGQISIYQIYHRLLWLFDCHSCCLDFGNMCNMVTHESSDVAENFEKCSISSARCGERQLGEIEKMLTP